tara:strand:+ start:7831 stop:8550 length:720 start_codon:yes stop_codon:yes gene_type:complete
MMKRRDFLVSVLAATLAAPAFAQSGRGHLNQNDASAGIREALSKAARLATDRLAQRDGFFGDAAVHIPLPRRVSDLQSRLRPLGLSGLLDDLELSLNRAAESAMPGAQRIFIDTVRTITVQDAVGIVRGGDTAATDYLRGRTNSQLVSLLRPPMQDALQGSGAYAALEPIEPYVSSGNSLFSRFTGGSGGGQTSLREDLTDHAVNKALDGVFYYVAREEQAVRRDPVSRTSDILRRVFG